MNNNQCINYGYKCVADKTDNRIKCQMDNCIKKFFGECPKSHYEKTVISDLRNNIDALQIQYKKISRLIAFNLSVITNLKDSNLLTEEGTKKYATIVKEYMVKNKDLFDDEEYPNMMNAYERSLHRDFLSKMY